MKFYKSRKRAESMERHPSSQPKIISEVYYPETSNPDSYEFKVTHTTFPIHD